MGGEGGSEVGRRRGKKREEDGEENFLTAMRTLTVTILPFFLVVVVVLGEVTRSCPRLREVEMVGLVVVSLFFSFCLSSLFLLLLAWLEAGEAVWLLSWLWGVGEWEGGGGW